MKNTELFIAKTCHSVVCMPISTVGKKYMSVVNRLYDKISWFRRTRNDQQIHLLSGVNRCFPVNFAKVLRKPFSQNTFGRLLFKTRNYIERFRCVNLSRKRKLFHSVYTGDIQRVRDDQFKVLKMTPMVECLLMTPKGVWFVKIVALRF